MEDKKPKMIALDKIFNETRTKYGSNGVSDEYEEETKARIVELIVALVGHFEPTDSNAPEHIIKERTIRNNLRNYQLDRLYKD